MDTKKLKIFTTKFKNKMEQHNSICYWFDSQKFVNLLLRRQPLVSSLVYSLLENSLSSLIDMAFNSYKAVNDLELKYVETEAVSECKTLMKKMMKTDISLSCSVLLYGEPGVGKTFVVDSLASEFQDWRVVVFKISDCLTTDKEKTNRASEADIEDYDEKKLIVVFDEIDKEVNDSNISIFLKKIDTIRKQAIIKQNRKIIIIMTSNKTPEELPAALIRAGRVSKKIEVKHWNVKEAKEFSRIFDIPFEELTKTKDGRYLAGQCFEDAQSYIISKL